VSLSSHNNVWNTCLRILRDRGFNLRVEGELEPDGSYPAQCFWIAEKVGFILTADNPIELLGLAAIYEHVKPTENQPYWWSLDGPDIVTELMERAFPDADGPTS
jgi:hypothetical protein